VDHPGIGISLSATALTVAGGGAAGTATVTLLRRGAFTAPVDITVEDAPAGVTATPSPTTIASGATTSTITTRVTAGTTPGTYPLTVRARAPGVSDATATLTVTVPVPPGFTAAFVPGTLTLSPGQSGTSVVTLAGVGGFAERAALTLDPPPAGITAALGATSMTVSDSVRLTVTASPTVVVGSYTLTVHAKPASLPEQVARLTVSVRALPPTGIIVVAGDKQSALVGTQVPIQPTVRVVDANGLGVSGATVTFTVTGGGGSVTAKTVATNPNGNASVGWTLGTIAGNNTLVAGVDGLPATSAVTLTATGVVSVASFVAVVAGDDFACALNARRQAVCWGDNTYGQLGDGTHTSRSTPKVVNGSATYSQLTAGSAHVCGLSVSGTQVFCWGRNAKGALGDLTLVDKAVPTQPNGLPTVSVLSAGGDHTCAITSATGAAYCWGSNSDGQLGDGTVVDKTRPTALTRAPTFRTIAAGIAHTCATTTAGVTMCWGRNTDGQLGDNTTTSHSLPAAVSGSPTFDVLALGLAHTCGLTPSGQAYCWGANAEGQLGDDTTTPHLVPAQVSGSSSFSSIASRRAHTCARTSTSVALCWGRNTDGQLGDGSTTQGAAPTAIFGAPQFLALAPGGAHTCGVVVGGQVQCWGKNDAGQLGDNTTTSHLTPAPIFTSGLGIRIAP
jgi:alpha-tubulin suppressor-like RCC1 family protein